MFPIPLINADCFKNDIFANIEIKITDYARMERLPGKEQRKISE